MSNGGRNILLGLGCIVLAPVAVVGVACGAAAQERLRWRWSRQGNTVGAGVIAAKTTGISSVSLGVWPLRSVGECLRD